MAAGPEYYDLPRMVRVSISYDADGSSERTSPLGGILNTYPQSCRARIELLDTTGCKSPTGKERSESILASSLAGGIARCRLKRRQRYQWAGRLSFEKPMEQDADSVPSGGRQHSNHVNREWIARSCVV